MGMFMGDSDPYIGSLLETLNLRFGKLPDTFPDLALEADLDPGAQAMFLGRNGIGEMQAIQIAVEVFKEGRPLVESLRAIGMGSLWNGVTNRRWFSLILNLDKHPSTEGALKGGPAIVKVLVDHLAPIPGSSAPPGPVYFKTHDLDADNRVLIIRNDKPVHYVEQVYLTISLPMKPRDVTLKLGEVTP